MSQPEAPGAPPATAIVIGGSGGVGSAVCRRLAANGVDLVLSYRGNEASAEQVAADCREAGVEAVVCRVDLTDPASVESCFAAAESAFGQVGAVVYAAGPDIKQPFVSQVTPDQWRAAMDAEANGFFNLIYCSLPRLRARGGSIVAVTSAGLVRYPPRDILSVGPKAAVQALVTAVAREEGRHAIRANCVALGVIDTGIFHRLKGGEFDAALVETMRHNTALKRFGAAEEVASAVAFFVSQDSSYVTGQTLVVDGGYSL